jgi:sigma-B regulation protein RsbU (phosphoserine phosphatase)
VIRVLIADDDRVGSTMLKRSVEQLGHEVIAAHDGDEAWRRIRADGSIAIAILDWMMPGVTGLELCTRIRQDEARSHLYVIMLTARTARADVVTGIEAGADDYLTKPFDPDELRVRLNVGVRIVTLQQRLASRVVELQSALARVRQLSGLLPICSYCKRIRNDGNYWEQIESFLAEHSEAEFTHGICPTCLDKARRDFEA